MLKKTLYVLGGVAVLAVLCGWQFFSYDLVFLFKDKQHQFNRGQECGVVQTYQTDTIAKMVVGDKLENVVIFSGKSADGKKTERLQKLFAENDVVYSEIKSDFDDENFKELLSRVAANKPKMYIVSVDFNGKKELMEMLKDVGSQVPVNFLKD